MKTASQIAMLHHLMMYVYLKFLFEEILISLKKNQFQKKLKYKYRKTFVILF